MRLQALSVPLRRLPHLIAGTGLSVLLFGIALTVILPGAKANANLLQLRSVSLSDPTTGATGVHYKFRFNTSTAASIGSISFEICTNYLYETTDICAPPSGLDLSGVTLSTSSGVTDFVPQPPTGSRVVLGRPAASLVSPQTLMYDLQGITNPDTNGSFYVHIATYGSTNGTGPEVDYGNVVFATTQDITITTEVPPYLLFCVGLTIDGFNCGTATGGFIDFGELSTKTTRAATSQMLASTNAPYGYSVTLSGQTMTAGNNIIPAIEGAASQIGVSQFGLNARSNSVPSVGADPDGPGLTMPKPTYGTPNQYRFVSGDIIASSDNTDDYRKMTVSYIVNRSPAQPPGLYVATISYICLANF